MMNDALCVVHPRAAGLDMHKRHITATVRLCTQTGGEPQCETRTFGALASGLAALVAWLTSHRVEAAAMEATGVYWHTPWQALTDAGVAAEFAQRPTGQATAWPQDRRRRRPLAGAGVPVRIGTAQFRPPAVVPRPAHVEPPSADAGRPAQPSVQPGAEGDRPRRRPHRRGADRHLRSQRPAHPRRSGRPAASGRYSGLAQWARPA